MKNIEKFVQKVVPWMNLNLSKREREYKKVMKYEKV